MLILPFQHSFIRFDSFNRDKDEVKLSKSFSRYILDTSILIWNVSFFNTFKSYASKCRSEVLLKSGGHVSAFIVYPLSLIVLVLQMTHTIILLLLIISVLYMTNIELVDFIGGIQAIIVYIYKFIYAFVKARKESNNLVFEDVL